MASADAAPAGGPLPKAPRCPEGHELVAFPCAAGSQVCDRCWRSIRASRCSRCGICDYDLCANCYCSAWQAGTRRSSPRCRGAGSPEAPAPAARGAPLPPESSDAAPSPPGSSAPAAASLPRPRRPRRAGTAPRRLRSPRCASSLPPAREGALPHAQPPCAPLQGLAAHGQANASRPAGGTPVLAKLTPEGRWRVQTAQWVAQKMADTTSPRRSPAMSSLPSSSAVYPFTRTWASTPTEPLLWSQVGMA